MRTVVLSDHPSEELRKLQAPRVAELARVQDEYLAALATHEQRLGELRDQCDRARAEHRWWRWLRYKSRLRRAQGERPLPPEPPRYQPTAREEQLKAGIEGEQIVVDRFAAMLGDEWVLFRGYKNGAGEIDHLLLGPQAVIAMEGKHHNGRFSCRGDEWWFQKLDSRGRGIEDNWGRVPGGNGRGPSRQLNDAVKQLARFLESRRQGVGIHTAILFTHPRTKWGLLQEQTVNLVGTGADHVLKGFVTGHPAQYEAFQLRELERLIERDHRHHEQRRARTRKASA
jgi:hypothetical protein